MKRLNVFSKKGIRIYVKIMPVYLSPLVVNLHCAYKNDKFAVQIDSYARS